MSISSQAQADSNSDVGRKRIPWSSIFLGIIAAVAATVALKQMHTLLIPLVFAWMIAQLLAPVVKFFARRRIPASLSTILALLALLLVFFWVSIFLSLSAAPLLNRLSIYGERIAALSFRAIEALSNRFAILSNESVQGEIREQIIGMIKFVMGFIGNLAGHLTSWMANMIIVFIMAGFMLIAQPFVERKIATAFQPVTAGRISAIMASISSKISRYLAIQLMLSLATGLLVWTSCMIVGVDAAITWGALAFFLNFIPVIGSIIAAIPPVLLALVQFPSIWPAVWLLIAIVVINQVIGNVISPLLMGGEFNVSPTTVLLSVMFWGWLWGIAGAFLSVLLTSAIKIICENISVLRPISVLMESGKRMR